MTPPKHRFRIRYAHGFEIIEAADIFEAADFAKATYRRAFLMPVAIEWVQ